MKVTNLAPFCLLLLISLGLGGASEHDADSMMACSCLNGGTFTGDACECPTGYGGLYCEQDNTDPEPYIACDSPCNNGLCDYTCGTCVCHPFYTGEQCDRALIIPCGDYYCFNEGTCEMIGSGMEFCQCPEGFSGEYCLDSSDSCNCLNGGECVTSAGSTTCSCSEGFTGEHCETEICSPECPFNAYCWNGTCLCYPGYTGENCDEAESGVFGWKRCGDYFCFNRGSCENGTCVCAEGFGGAYCELSTDCTEGTAVESCAGHYCYYGGTCRNDTCYCPAYTFGVYCEYVKAPTAQLTLTVESHVTSATLSWNTPSGYETIASSGGVRYTVTVENMATGRKYTVMASDVSITETLVHSTEYCFTVRPEVSGGSGVYSERKCITVPDHASCFCANGGQYDAESKECNCQSSYRGDYCEVPTTEAVACPAESKFNSELEHLFTWSKTPAGQTVRLPCPCNSTIDLASEVYATRSCSDVGVWGTPDSSGCNEATVRDLCEVNSYAELLNRTSSLRAEMLQAGGVAVVLGAVEALAMDEAQSWPADTLLDSIDNALSVPDHVLAMTQQISNAADTLVRTLDEITKGALEGSGPGTSWTRPRSNFAVSGVAIDRENLPDRGFHIAFGSGFEGKVKALLRSYLFNDMSCNTSVIFSSVINKMAVFAATVEGDTDGNNRIVSPVLSVTIGNCAINGTMEAIEITFLVPQSAPYDTLDCYYWKSSVNNGQGAWSKDGCTKKGQLESGEVVCGCNHLTTFAVLQTLSVQLPDIPVVYIVIAAGGVLAVVILLIVVSLVAVCCCCSKKGGKSYFCCCRRKGPKRGDGDEHGQRDNGSECKENLANEESCSDTDNNSVPGQAWGFHPPSAQPEDGPPQYNDLLPLTAKGTNADDVPGKQEEDTVVENAHIETTIDF